MELGNIAKLIGEIGVLLGVVIPIVSYIMKLVRGQRCQLRSEMLSIYYRYKDSKTIPQFEYENFMEMHGAYKALHGNSFADKICADIKKWDISSEDDEEN